MFSTTFQSCTALTTVSLPNVTTIGLSTFNDCTSLTSIDLSGLSRTILTSLGGSVGNNSVFLNVPNTGTLTVPVEYQTNNGGNPDGDIQYLTTAPRSWTINYI
jgi:hypothetical protein